MLRGFTELSLDTKGRLAIPSRYREHLVKDFGGQLIVTSYRAILFLYPLPKWEEVERKLVNLPNLDESVNDFIELLTTYATECVLDNQGRILIPQILREKANLEKQVVLIGRLNKFEIWDDQTWKSHDESRQARNAERPPEQSAALAQFSF